MSSLDNIPPGEPRKLLYKRKESALLLSISQRKLDYLIANREIAVRRVGRSVLVPHSSLVAFARAGKTGGQR